MTAPMIWSCDLNAPRKVGDSESRWLNPQKGRNRPSVTRVYCTFELACSSLGMKLEEISEVFKNCEVLETS